MYEHTAHSLPEDGRSCDDDQKKSDQEGVEQGPETDDEPVLDDMAFTDARQSGCERVDRL